MSDAKNQPVATPAAPDASEQPGRRTPVPMVLMPPMCCERDCRSLAAWLPVMVIRPVRADELLHPERSYEARSALPSSVLCDMHARELQLHPQHIFSADGWQRIEEAYKHAGRLPPDITRLSIELEQLPDPDVIEERRHAIREHLRRFEQVQQEANRKQFEEIET